MACFDFDGVMGTADLVFCSFYFLWIQWLWWVAFEWWRRRQGTRAMYQHWISCIIYCYSDKLINFWEMCPLPKGAVNPKSCGWHKAKGSASILLEFKRDCTAPLPPRSEHDSKKHSRAGVPWEAGRLFVKASPGIIHSFWMVGSLLDFGASKIKCWVLGN